MAKTYSMFTWIDEILAGAARYLLKNDAGATVYNNAQISLATAVTTPATPVSAARMNAIENGIDTLDDMLVTYTTGGSSTAYTFATSRAPALTTGERWRICFNASAGAAPTLNRDGRGAKSLKYYNSADVKVACDVNTIVAGQVCEVYYDGTDYVVFGAIGFRLSNNLGPDGTMYNGKIVVSIASNNLTVAIKNKAGNDPSAADPVTVVINGVQRSITAALSVTLAAATNWMNLGATETAAKEADLFVYLSWRAASSAVVVGVSRIPYACVYGDFNATSTNEKSGNFNTTPASTDDVVIVGRIAATLSGGAGYTWTSSSASAPTTGNTIQHPIYETRRLAYLPVGTSQTGSITTMGACNGSYHLIGCELFFDHWLPITTNGTGGGSFRGSIPFSPASNNVAIPGRETGVTGAALNGITSSNFIQYTTVSNGYPGANSAIIMGGGNAVRLV